MNNYNNYKLRVWFKNEKKIFSVSSIDFDFETVSFIDKHNVYRDINFKDVELMRYTGLHDDNGKEIYEGDIVRIYVDNGQILKIQVEMPRVYDEIREDLTGFKYEVIGNKYENPELL